MPVIPAGFSQVTLVLGGTALPNGAVTTWGVDTQIIEEPQAIVEELYLAGAGLVAEVCTSNTTLEAVELKFGPTATGPTFRFDGTATGNQGTNALPPNTALLVRKTITGLSNRFAGRAFMPGIPESIIDSAGIIESASVAQFQGAFTEWYEALVSIIGPPVVFSATSSDPQESTSFNVQGRVATQRRRLRR